VADNPRIEELRRRVQSDPASIAFAQLAEEYRRAGNYHEAIAACRGGLTIHPGYLSARVTLGRSLLEVNELDAAETELVYVLQNASENLAAIRGLAEVYHRRGQLAEALKFYQSALHIAKHDPDLEQVVHEISHALVPEPAPFDEGMSFEEAQAEFLAALDGFEALGATLEDDLAPIEPAATRATSDAAETYTAALDEEMAPIAPSASIAPMEPVVARQLVALEHFLDAIRAYRRRRAVQSV
jgi:tetratricopeptide (TPR) repeat protein